MKQHARVVSLAVVILGMLATALAAQVFLPGTQPREIHAKFSEVAQCAMCHAKTRSGPDAPLPSWQNGMMSQAMRDPVFRTALAVANQDIEGIGDFCLRYHTPSGFLEGRADPPDASALMPSVTQRRRISRRRVSPRERLRHSCDTAIFG